MDIILIIEHDQALKFHLVLHILHFIISVANNILRCVHGLFRD
jgi:hypothetical protein